MFVNSINSLNCKKPCNNSFEANPVNIQKTVANTAKKIVEIPKKPKSFWDKVSDFLNESVAPPSEKDNFIKWEDTQYS